MTGAAPPTSGSTPSGSPPTPHHRARVCSAAACGLRFPVPEGTRLGERCPLCGAPALLRDEPWDTARAAPPARPLPGPEVCVLLDSVRSLRNVGAVFRTADGAGLSHVYLGGITPTPAHPDLAKTALGAERSVPWTHEADAVVLAGRLRESGVRLVALEGGAGDEFFATLPWAAGRYCLVVGHEVSGIDPRLQALCERTVYLPMAGVKGSLNVSVALGIAAYCVRHGVTAPP